MKKLLITLLALVGFAVFPHHAKAAAYDYQITYQSPYVTVNHGTHSDTKLDIKNIGTSAWNFTGPNAIHLGTSHPMDRGSGFYDSTSWLASNRIAMTRNLTDPSNTTTIQPNQVGEFEFTVTTNADSYDDMGGSYPEYFQPVIENITWMRDVGLYWNWTVPAKVGALFYTWYGPGETRWAGTVDTPHFGTINGHYDSDDPNVITQQLTAIQNAGIQFVVFSWWENLPPPGDTAHQHQAVVDTINIMHQSFPNLKYAFMVEPTLNNQVTPIPQGFYNDIWNAYGGDPQYLHYHGKPLMSCYLFRTCTGQDGRFSGLQFSGAFGYSYPTLLLWHYQYEDVQGDVSSLFARFDNHYIGGSTRYNVTYQESIQQDQLNFIAPRKNSMRLLFYYGWNEYYERANIEPHDNPDSPVGPTYPLDILSNWITNTWHL